MYNLSINGNEYNVIIKEVTEEDVRVEVNGVEHIVAINKISNLSVPDTSDAPKKNEVTAPLMETNSQSSENKKGEAGTICSPIPGHVLEVSVQVGDKVLAGQKVLVLEAMKMENIITAEKSGMVKKILVSEGDAVNHDQTLMIIG